MMMSSYVVVPSCCVIKSTHVHLQPFTNDFPRADIHEMMSPDLLHQVIKGTFKDHLVSWVEAYIALKYGRDAEEVLRIIDRRSVPRKVFRSYTQSDILSILSASHSRLLLQTYGASLMAETSNNGQGTTQRPS
jgi:hypothetical protein